MSEHPSDQGGQERRVGPTVSRDKWFNHARQKMARGYVLIMASGRRSANFWLRDKGYEMCAYDVARQLIASGEVVPVGEHHLGTMYALQPAAPEPPAKLRPAPSRPKEELDVLLDTLSDEEQDEAEPEPA